MDFLRNLVQNQKQRPQPHQVKKTPKQHMNELNQHLGSNSNSNSNSTSTNINRVKNSGIGWVGGKRKTRKGKGKKGKKQTKKVKKTRRNRKGKK